MAYKGTSNIIDLDLVREPGERFVFQELIGEGTYGEVYSARDTISGDRVAVKILENVCENIEEIEEEYLVLRDLSVHPNLPTFYGIYLKRALVPEEDQLWFIMELCDGGSVTDIAQHLKKDNSRMTEDQIAYILSETVEGLAHLHRNRCIHRDIKGHNILLTDDARVKLIDFGVSSRLSSTNDRKNTSVGTPYWMAPEVIACEDQLDSWYDGRCDVWSLGITAIELAEGEPPLSEERPVKALVQIGRRPPPTLRQPHRYPRLSQFLKEVLVKDIEQRPTAAQLLDHPFIKRGASLGQAVRIELQREIRRLRAYGRSPRRPELTTKYGKLKSNKGTVEDKTVYIDDLASFEVLTEDAIVQHLKKRFEVNLIYTYIGDIIIAVNPYTCLGLYTAKEQKKYGLQGAKRSPAHVFSVAGASYQALIHHRHNQSIVITGESAAGKTHTGNILFKQLVYLGKGPKGRLEERLLQVNPLVEALGNAQTGINANSSRFGKFLELLVSDTGRISGARLYVYLLEQSRVVQQAKEDRNFHVFYYLYDGLSNEGRLLDFGLDQKLRQEHTYLPGDRLDASTRTKNIKRFHEIKSAFQSIGFKEKEIDSVFTILAAILHLGDIKFGEVISRDNTDNKSKVLELAPLNRAARLLGLEEYELLHCLTANAVVTRGEKITRHNSVVEAAATRDAMVKALYSRIFDWIVNCVNMLLSGNTRGDTLVIGILDIFGFENLSNNSFEQLCINIANEHLQYYFNQRIFSWEQQEYMAEGIPVDLVEFTDNRPVLDMLLSKPMGLLALLDEESRFPRSTDKTLIDKFHANIKNKLYVRPNSNALCFAVQHFAGRVIYQAGGFLDKNRHFLAPEVVQLLRGSKHDLVRFLFQCPITKTGNLYSANSSHAAPHKETTKNIMALQSQSRAQQTAATYFRYSLMELLQRMVGGTPQFVRCIKPNDTRTPRLFDSMKVLRQLRYIGVMETIRIRQQGFSHRIPFADFLNRYGFLAFDHREEIFPSKENARLLLVRLNIDGWALGKTKVFLKYYHIEYLSRICEEKIRKIILVQACVRRWLAQVKYSRYRKKTVSSIITLQKYVRGWLARRRIKKMHHRLNRNVQVAMKQFYYKQMSVGRYSKTGMTDWNKEQSSHWAKMMPQCRGKFNSGIVTHNCKELNLMYKVFSLSYCNLFYKA
ncbi:hypothetical protein AAG570_007899 [Ranatra chinensis]|uniref:non-specific serine/threonine protein kinase n=1 Tax=Ranatra chinensis TaxID=642074 RepID=A0ABD0Y8G3_9HEMI